MGTLALCTFQAARRGRRGEGESVSGVSRLRVLDAVLAGSAASGSRRSIVSIELRF